jgi:twinkle protein
MKDNSESEFLRHEPCPHCGSSDARSVYSDGHTYCFSCETYEAGDSECQPPSHSKKAIYYDGDFGALHKRRITEETCRKFNVRLTPDEVRFPYTDETGKVVAYKSRNRDKEFTWVGKSPKRLFGQNLFGTGKRLVITEGEMDALSVWEAMPGWPVVSIPNGASAAKKSLQNQLQWILGFDEVILLFDNDPPGAGAAAECCELLPPEKVKTGVLLGHKDASEALQAKEAQAIRVAIWNALPYQPANIKDGKDLLELLKEPVGRYDALYPFKGLNTLTGGLRKREVVTLVAGTGVGKSTFSGEIAQHLISQGERVGYIALEESIQRTGLRLMTVFANRPLHLNNTVLSDAEFEAAFNASVGSGNFWLRDGFGSVDPDHIIKDVRFLSRSKEVGWVILDHISIMVSGMEGNDERKMIDRAVTQLRSLVEETSLGLIMISHLSKPAGERKGHEDGGQVTLRDIRGSHAISQLSDLVIALERDISSGDDITRIRVLKNRHSGWTGPAGQLKYSKKTGRLTEAEELPTKEDFGGDDGDF